MKKSAQMAVVGVVAALLSPAGWAQTPAPAQPAPAAKTAAPARPSIAVPSWVVESHSLDQAKDAVKIKISKFQIILQALDRMSPEQFKQWQQNAMASKKSAPAPAKGSAPAPAKSSAKAPAKK